MRVQLDTVAFSYSQTNPWTHCTFEFHTSLELTKNPEFLCAFEVSQSLNWGLSWKGSLGEQNARKNLLFPCSIYSLLLMSEN